MPQPQTEPVTMAIQLARPTARKRKSPSAALLLIPALLFLALLFGGPLVEITVRSLSDPTWGLQNFGWVFTTTSNLVVGLRTIVMGLCVTAIALVLSYPVAYLMTIANTRSRQLLVLGIMIPLWTSLLVRTLAWVVLLQDSGPINDVLEAIGLGRVPLIRTPFGVALGMTQVLMPFMVLPLYSAMARIDLRLISAARSLGATGVTAFRSIYLPLSRPGIVSGCVSVFVLALGFFIIPSLLGSPSESLLSSLIQTQIGSLLAWGHGAALGISLLAVTVLILLVVGRAAGGVSIIPSQKELDR